MIAFGRSLIAGCALVLVSASPASAVLVYERGSDPQTHVFVAHDDGSAPRRIARGFGPQVSRDGRRVAYFAGRLADKLYTVGVHGRHRRLVARYASWPGGVVWSPDRRRLVVGEYYDRGVLLIDLRRRTRHLVRTSYFGGGSFAPDGASVVVESDPWRAAGELIEIDVRSRHGRYLRRGSSPVWGPPGLAFALDANAEFDPWDPGYERPPPPDSKVLLRRQFEGDAHSVLHEDADLLPIAWSADGRRLLVSEWRRRTGLHALLLDLKTKALTRISTRLSSVAGLSRDGRSVLGERDDDVVAVSARGSLKVLARGARHPSWTR